LSSPSVTETVPLFGSFTLAMERMPCNQVLTTMKHILTRLVSVVALGAAMTGCATVPGDPYYQAPGYTVYEQPGYVYGGGPVYRAPPAPIVYPYGAPPAPVYHGGRDRWDNDRDRDRQWRERERDRDREARERDRERREQLAREADRRAREQAERDRRAAESRRPDYQRPGQMAPGSYAPHPQDWRTRQQTNNPDKP